MRFEIILDVQGIKFNLDTNGIDNMSITYNVADIKDISVTKGSYSKTIVIPNTVNNRKVFSDITNISSEAPNFNPNLRNRAFVLVDSQCVFEGYFQLTDVNINKKDGNDNLSLLIFADNNDFYTMLGEDYLEDLDLRRFDHNRTADNIIESWTKDYKHGYYYGLMDTGQDWDITMINGTTIVSGSASTPQYGVVNVLDFYPSIYVRTLFDQIFAEAGFQWKSKSLTSDTPFNDLIIPFSNKTIEHTAEYIQQRYFRAYMDADTAIVETPVPGQLNSSYKNLLYSFPQNWSSRKDANGNYIAVYPHARQMDSSAQSDGATMYSTREISVSLNRDTKLVKFSQELDPNNLWNTTVFEYTNTSAYNVTQRFQFDMKIKQLFYYTKQRPPRLVLRTNMNADGTANANGRIIAINQAGGTDWENVTDANGWILVGSKPRTGQLKDIVANSDDRFERLEKQFNSPLYSIRPGEKIWLEYNFVFGGVGDSDATKYSPQGAPVYHYLLGNKTVAKILKDSTMSNDIPNNTFEGDYMEFNLALPRKVKKKDFVLSIIKMFNLIIEPDKDFPKTLNIETRETYYKNGAIKDWSKKIDLNQDIDIQILGDTLNKKTRFKYKDDKDFLNLDYSAKTNRSYGEHVYNSKNEFAQSENNLEIIFSPTPMTGLTPFLTNTDVQSATQSAIIIPKIAVVNNNVVSPFTSNIRILLKKYITDLPKKDWWKFNNQMWSSYPYSGHFSDPYQLNFDLNFGVCDGYFFPTSGYATDNLFTKYWKSMIDEITDRDSRIMTCKMYLTPQDIINFKFSDKIFLDYGDGGQYYKVNKIDGYNPTTTTTCKVELIRTKDITLLEKRRPLINVERELNVKVDKWIRTVIVGEGKNEINRSDSFVEGAFNRVNGLTFTKGNNNVIEKEASVFGNNNRVLSEGTHIIGHNNFVYNEVINTKIIGDNNTINSGSANISILGNNNITSKEESIRNAYVIGDDVVVNTSGSVNIGGVLIVNNNWIVAGRNEILNPFSTNSVINHVQAGKDAVRNLGSNVNIMQVKSGRDSIL
jgi:hypothetical protein